MSQQFTPPCGRACARRLSGYFLTVLAALLITAFAPNANAQCKVVYTISSQWSGGFGAAISIQNTGTTALGTWTLTWAFANGQTVSQFWNGTATQSGSNVTVTNMSYNGSIPAGATLAGIGFNGTWNNVTNAIPTSFSVNGTACNTSLTATTTALAASSTTTATGTSITLTASVSPSAATGTVSFYDGTTALGTGSLSSGKATLSTSFSTAGTHSITAVYGGSATYATSTSSAVSITVTAGSKTATTTTVSSSTSSTTTGTSLTLTANVAPAAATGTVTFYDGSTALGTGTLSGGAAALSTSFSTAGTHTITAAYGGSTTYAASTSGAMSITVTSSGSCSTTNPIVPYISVSGTWTEESAASVSSATTSVDIGPQPVTGGSWSWSGPNGFTSASREIDNIALSDGTNVYTATYTLNGCSYKQAFTITVTSTTVLAPGDHNETITSSGLSRNFIVHIPTGYTGSTATPAIIDFHWYGADASTQEGASGWKQKCDSVGCIVVYPESAATASPANSWDSGYCCGGVSDDTQFPRDIITWLKANTNLDASRVYASGGSNGGAQTYAMACWNSDVFAAVAAVDFRCVTGTQPNPGSSVTSLTPSNNTACSCPNLKRPITVVDWDEGLDTTFIPYQGGVSSTGLPLVSAQVNIETFGYFSGCTGSATPDPANSLCQTWTSCKSNVTETLCTNPSSVHLSTYSSTTNHWIDVTWDRISVQSLPAESQQ
jgi:poly(3-hydroxybutyrate) depolymerase